MVTAISKGRLGNFSFVNMAAYAYSLKHGLEFHIQDRSLATQWPLYFQELKNPNWDESLEKVYVNDGKHSYTELPFKEEWRNKNIVIGTEDINTGYLQSFLYLKGYEDEIRIKFGLPTTFYPRSVGVHVRRTDFISIQNKHPLITKRYIQDAIRTISFHIDDNAIIAYYSDDINWVKENCWDLVGDEKRNFYSNGKPALEDFKELMKCQHLITSNSSFSVLAATLNSNPNKIVICPEKFFGEGNKHLDESTIYPHGWVKIKY